MISRREQIQKEGERLRKTEEYNAKKTIEKAKKELELETDENMIKILKRKIERAQERIDNGGK